MTTFSRTLIICLIIITSGYNLIAQESDTNKIGTRKKIDFSIYFGFNFTNFQGDAAEFGKILNNSTGLNLEEKWRSFIVPVGLSASFNATSWLSFKSGVLFAPKGIKYADEIDVGMDRYGINLILKLHYIEIPTLIEISATSNRNTHFYINGGISPSFKVTSKIVTAVWIIDASPDPSDEESEAEDWEDVNKFDLGYIIGGGIKTQDIYLGVQFEKGSKLVSSTGWNFKNQAFTFLMGFYF